MSRSTSTPTGQSSASSRERAADGAERAAGPVVPGMPNLHSHAFQRALAGRTGRANADGDSFWTWRQAMYAFLDRVDADAFEAIAAQAYRRDAEGRLHGGRRVPLRASRSRRARRTPIPAELARRVIAAAADAGIALTLLPVFYAHGGFGGRAARGRRSGASCTSVDSFARLVASLARDAKAQGVVLGVAPHSLRAVTPDELAAVVALVPSRTRRSTSMPPSRPAKSPTASPGRARGRSSGCSITPPSIRRWCVVHATHVTARRGAARRERRHRRARADHGSRSRRRHVPRARRTSTPAARSASAAIRTRSSIPSPSCASSSGRSGWRTSRATCSPTAPSRSAWRSTRSAARGGAAALVPVGRCDRGGDARRPRRAERRRSRARGPAARRRCSMRRSSVRAGARCAT